MSTKGRPRTKRDTKAEPQAEPAAQAAPAVWQRLVAAVRGGVNELGEAIAESQALRILDQEIRDHDAELHRVRATLAETLARSHVANERLATANAKLTEYEGYAVKALKAGEEALAREVAAKIALLEIERDGEAARVKDFAEGVAHLRATAARFEATIQRLKQQVDTVRASESVQRAQAAVASRRRASDVRVRTALDSLERLRQRQTARGARLDAEDALDEAGVDDALEARLRCAGIIADEDRTDSVLSRLKKQAD